MPVLTTVQAIAVWTLATVVGVGLGPARAADAPIDGVRAAADADSATRARDSATALLLDGRPVEAEALLRTAAEAGDVASMERLALWHLHGDRLLGPGPWQRDEAHRWLARARAQGSALALRLGIRAPLAAR